MLILYGKMVSLVNSLEGGGRRGWWEWWREKNGTNSPHKNVCIGRGGQCSLVDGSVATE